MNLLPKDGSGLYIPGVFDESSCTALFASLLGTIDWKEDQLVMFGKLITTKRKVAWVGDAGGGVVDGGGGCDECRQWAGASV